MRTMYDSVTAGNIASNAEVVAGYVEGLYKWSKADWDRFPNSVKVTIAIWAADADVLDIETGDATPEMAPDWLRRQYARGVKVPTLYCNLSTLDAVQRACQGMVYDLWLAHYTQVPHCPSYAAACQYADPGPVDLSLCQDHWPRHTPHVEEDPMANILAQGRESKLDPHGAGATYLVANWPAGPKRYISTPEALAKYQALGIPFQIVEQYVLDDIPEVPGHYETFDPNAMNKKLDQVLALLQPK